MSARNLFAAYVNRAGELNHCRGPFTAAEAQTAKFEGGRAARAGSEFTVRIVSEATLEKMPRSRNIR